MKQLPIIVILSGMMLSSCKDFSQNASDPKSRTQHQESIKLFLHNYIDEIWNQRDFSDGPSFAFYF